MSIKTTTKEEEVVSVPKNMLEEMQKKIEANELEMKKMRLQMAEEEGIDLSDDEEVKDKTTTIRKWDGKLCIGFNKKRGTWLKYDTEKREDKLMQEIVLLDDKGKITNEEVDFLFFMDNAEVVKVPLLKIETKVNRKEVGTVPVSYIDDTFKKIITGKRVKQFVTSNKDTAIVKLPNGDNLELDIDFINI